MSGYVSSAANFVTAIFLFSSAQTLKWNRSNNKDKDNNEVTELKRVSLMSCCVSQRNKEHKDSQNKSSAN